VDSAINAKNADLLLAKLIERRTKLKTLPAKRNINKNIKNRGLPVSRDIEISTKIESLLAKRDTAKLTWTNIKRNVDRLGIIDAHALEKQRASIPLLT